MAKSFFTIDEISQIVNGKGASLLPKKEVKEKEPLTDRDELLKMVFGGSILPSQTLQDSALQLDQALASNKALNGLRTATAVAGLVGDAAVEAVGIAEESYNNIYGENALAKKISEKPIKRLEGKAFGSEGKKKILAALGIDEEDTREVEVEGGEIIENEDGTTQKVEGPKHEQGGVDAMIDDDATVYSDRLQSLIGASKVEKTAKSIAEEKEKRDAKVLSLQKKLEKNPNDRLLANTLALTLQQNMIADQMDLMWQQIARMGLEEQAGGKEQLINAMFNKQDKTESEESEKQQEPQPEEEQQEQEEEVNQEKLALGKERTKEKLLAGTDPTITIPANPDEGLTENQKKAQEEAARISLISEGVGNILGNQLYYTGAIVSGLGGLNTTLQQRSEDILHENKYKGLARSVDKLYEQSISNISNVTNKRLQEMLNESQTTKQSIGNNFQSISNMAAYNAMLDDAVNKELAKIRGEELGAITGIQDARAKTLSTNMQKEMEGQGIAEALNDADRDAFYNALHLDYANIGTQMQAVASNMNKKYEDKTDLAKLLDEIKNIGNENNQKSGGENTGTDNESKKKENEKPKTEQVPTPPVTTSPSSNSSATANIQTENQTNQSAQTTDANAEEVTASTSSTQQTATNAEEEPLYVITIKNFYEKEVGDLTNEELSEFLKFENVDPNVSKEDLIAAKKEKAKRDAEQENATKQIVSFFNKQEIQITDDDDKKIGEFTIDDYKQLDESDKQEVLSSISEGNPEETLKKMAAKKEAKMKEAYKNAEELIAKYPNNSYSEEFIKAIKNIYFEQGHEKAESILKDYK